MKDMGMTIDTDILEKWAENQARSADVNGWASVSSVSAQVSANIHRIELFASRVGLWAEKNRFLPQEFEWLLDNRYLILREAAETTRLLKRKGRLPADKDGVALYTLARALVRSGRGEVTQERIEKFLRGAQKNRALLEKELWLLVPMLRAALTQMAAWICGEMEAVLNGYRRAPERDPFAAELAIYRARESGSSAPEGAEELSKGAQAVHSRLSTLIGAMVTSLRMLSVTDLSRVLREASAVESMLRKDPAGIYPKMDEASRGRYRQRLSRLAKKAGLPEDEAAERILALCKKASGERERHVGAYLYDMPMGKKPLNAAGAAYFMGMALITALLSAAGSNLSGVWWIGLLLMLPASDMAKNICDWAAAKLVRPRPIPRLELKGGIPDEGRTLCVISTLLTDLKSVAELSKKLEYFSLSNRDSGKNLRFGILGDLPDASMKRLSGDKRIIDEAQKQIFELNRKYGGGFYLFLRERELNLRDGRYMGWERKRGAIMELVRLLRQLPTGLHIATGDSAALRGVKYIITLDSDTQLVPGAARKLAGGMLHPLCRPKIDERRNVVVEGYGIILPRMSVELEAAGKSLFSRVYAGQGGLDPYGGMAGDVYHDLFDQGSFVGKGILDVDAALKVLDGRFPENRVLSHDLLEGSYLRAGLMGDIELTDGYPCKVTNWFDRLHRWTRGDWQIASWILWRVPCGSGRERNPISALSRWKIFDNIRRSVSGAALLTLLTLGLLSGGNWALAAGFAALCALSNLMLSAAEMAFRGKGGRGVRCHSTIITGFRAVLLQTVFQLLFLPYNAFVSIGAALTALFRLIFSRKKLLEWVTAAQSEKFTQSAITLCRKMFPCIAWGVLTACFAPGLPGWLAGVAWALSPIAAASISRVENREEPMPDADRAFLLRQAALMWQYFEDLLTPEDNYLPPDNWQEQPAAGTAHRTSPTNIGLALMCALSAADLELCSRDRALHLIDRVLDTIERLPKWHGHIYNWYDTRTLEPLRPNCVSTVDSGNLAGYLIALKQGLLEINDAAAEDLACRAGKLADEMDFTPLYDDERKLFVISCDMETQKRTEGYYDLLASEARLTSYLAIARGEVEKENWVRLGRAMSGDDSYRGMASWTGTMFEYFMPHLVLPIYENSLLFESLYFALYCQRKRGAEQKTPWGISESCFYAFDAALNYQYKAHGVPSLAYKRGVGKENVVSPYSSFLALLLSPAPALKNLRRLRELGLEGRYGMCEAADFTPARLSGGEKYEPVRCFMSHHIGMSLVAVCNALKDDIWQKRFMSDPSMGAFACMLQERVPVGGTTVRPEGREVPEKPKRAQGEGLRREISSINPDCPRGHILSNSSYTIFCTDGGLTSSTCGGMAVNRFEPNSRSPGGMSFYFKSGNNTISMLPVPGQDQLERYDRAVFEGGSASWEASREQFESVVTAWIPENENAEVRRVRISNTSGKELEGRILLYFEPVMQAMQDFSAHPAFSKLFLETSRTRGGVVIKRRPRGGKGEKHLCCLCDHEEATFDTSREKVLGRRGEAALTEGEISLTESFGAVLDPCVLVSVPVRLKPGSSSEITFSLAFAEAERDALSAAERSLKLREAPRTGRMDGLTRTLGLTQAEVVTALDMLSPLVFNTKSVPRDLAEGLKLGQSGLWKLGISGDLPIMTARAMDATQLDKLGRVIRMHRFLNRCGMLCDLVILSRDGGNYRRPARSAVMETLKALGCENALGSKGGIHHVDLAALSEQEELLLRAVSRVSADKIPDGAEVPKYAPVVKTPAPAPIKHESKPCEWMDDGAFRFETGNGLPPAGWGHLLANGSYGALVTECGTGYMWRRNARENKMLPWTNDPLANGGEERISLLFDGFETGIFSANDGLPCEVTYGFGYARWEKTLGQGKVTTTAFVPRNRMARVLIVETEGLKDAQICYSARLAMGVSDSHSGYIQIKQEKDGVIKAENPYNTAFSPQIFALAASVPPEHISGRPGELNAKISTVRRKGKLRAVIVTGCAQNAPGLELLRALADDREADIALGNTVGFWRDLVGSNPVDSGSEQLDNYLNGWALYQVVACRLFGRTSLYQCGGAYGFRDQLQDVCAALYADPGLTRTQILRACAHQYEEGDGQHWWHPGQLGRGEGDKGVRTRCSDDLLWLPYTVCEYLDFTGDGGLLDLRAPFIASPSLALDAHDRYETPRRTEYRATVYEHCVRAIDLALHRGVGIHGLALMGAGDWNDGFNLVGDKGSGESVWLSWFLAHVCERMAPICEARGDTARAESYQVWRENLIRACEGAWDGQWFRRGYYDDGATLGSHMDEECRIDSIAQSWSAFFKDSVPDGMVESALDSAWERLVDEKHRLVRLFEPAFEKSAKNPGYIKGYVPGVRENGGQYTHAAVWLAMGCHLAGLHERAAQILNMLLPATHPIDEYKTEPYVLAADVYHNPAHAGRGGWSNYTGAAAWYYRVAMETLGLGRTPSSLSAAEQATKLGKKQL